MKVTLQNHMRKVKIENGCIKRHLASQIFHIHFSLQNVVAYIECPIIYETNETFVATFQHCDSKRLN